MKLNMNRDRTWAEAVNSTKFMSTVKINDDEWWYIIINYEGGGERESGELYKHGCRRQRKTNWQPRNSTGGECVQVLMPTLLSCDFN